jgi:membrane protein implicated in regulation of membrane protease activity
MTWWVYFWLGVMILTGILEVITLGLTCIWFTVGAAAAWIAALCGGAEWLQLVLFFAVSLILLLCTRPIVVKYMKVGSNKTNVEAIPGKLAVVCQKIQPVEGLGQVKLAGQIWSAKPEDGISEIEEGTPVSVVSVEGVKLVVKTLSM